MNKVVVKNAWEGSFFRTGKKIPESEIETEWSSTIVTILSKSIREKTACGN
jgi:hypothetical protein